MSAPRMIVHNVFFTLGDPSAERIGSLVGACHKYLTDHPGVTFFAAGSLVEEFNRPVNVRDFHVALTVVFENVAAHDAYQIAPRHLEFIDEQKPYWSAVRVFDSWA